MFRHRLEIWISANRMRVVHGKTGKAIERVAELPFSSARMLVADTDAAVGLLKAILIDLEGRRRWFAWPTAVIHPMELCDDGLSPVEKRAIGQMAEALGFAKVEISGERDQRPVTRPAA